MSTETEPRLRLEQYLGLQIKRQRQAQSLKLADVARIAGISQGMLSKIENARCPPASTPSAACATYWACRWPSCSANMTSPTAMLCW